MRASCPMVRRPLRPLAIGGILFGATLWFGVQVPTAAERTTDQTAMSLPRPAPPGGAGGIPGLPQVLSPSEAARLRRLFAAQSAGDFPAAAREMDRLDDRRLVGHVLADRYTRPGGGATPAALNAWLAQYADHPDATRMHALLAETMPRGAALPPAPPLPEPLAPEADLSPEEREASPTVNRSQSLDRTLRDRAREGNAAGGLALINATRGLAPAYAQALKADLAIGLFHAGRDEDAFRIASELARTGAPAVQGRAAFAAGLAAWGLGHYDVALPYFERAARSGTTPALRSAAAFWTARAAVRARRPQLYVSWMLQAGQEPRTFYGLVARRALGLPSGFAWESDLSGEAEGAALAETAGGWRALALLQIGQPVRAEAELRQLWVQARSNPGLVQAMLAVSAQAGLTGLASQLASAAQGADSRPRDFARYPLPPLLPNGGFRVDPALLYAMVGLESNFNAAAVSRAGARGLLQLMPSTASYVAGDRSLLGRGAQRLHDPAFSLEVGQRYLHVLAQAEQVEGNLIRLLAAYNAGVGNLQRWLPANGHRNDPFLFIESIPFDETRGFVQKVLAHSWIYASRLGLPARSLDQIAAGSFPRFAGPEEVVSMLQERARRLN